MFLDLPKCDFRGTLFFRKKNGGSPPPILTMGEQIDAHKRCSDRPETLPKGVFGCGESEYRVIGAIGGLSGEVFLDLGCIAVTQRRHGTLNSLSPSDRAAKIGQEYVFRMSKTFLFVCRFQGKEPFSAILPFWMHFGGPNRGGMFPMKHYSSVIECALPGYEVGLVIMSHIWTGSTKMSIFVNVLLRHTPI